MGAGIDEVVWSTVRKLLLDSDALAARLDGWLSRALDAKDDRERLRQAATRLAELQKQRERLIDAYQAGALDLADFQSRKETIEERSLAVEHECAELNSRESRRELARRQADGARTVAERLREHLHDPEFETKQAILRLVLDKVVVTGHQLELHLALPVSGDFGLTSDWRASPTSFRTFVEVVNRRRATPPLGTPKTGQNDALDPIGPASVSEPQRLSGG